MSEQLKFLVSELQKAPFRKTFNLITFDSLAGEQLLQTLNDVIAEIDPKHNINIRHEEMEQTAVRLLGVLRILKYKPPDHLTGQFRQGLVQGEKVVIYPVLEWLLERIPELKKRAYIARYLVKLDVPPEISADADVADVYEQYEELIEQFKAVHKESENIKNSGYSTADIRKDIEEMEKEKEIVNKRIERMVRKVEGMPNLEQMLEVARRLRLAREREKELASQKVEQRTSITHYKQRIQRLEQHLQDLRQSSMGATPEGLMQKLEEEVKVNMYIVREKMPKELESRRSAVASLQTVLAQPALGKDDIKNLENKIRDVNEEIKEISNKKNVTNDPLEDKLALFRQQSAIIRRKKETTAEKLSDVRASLASVEEEVEEKRDQVQSFAGETILRGEDFKRYVNSLREKSSIYKQKRAELSDLKSEYGVLERTKEILKSREEGLLQTLSMMESERGVSGFRSTKDNLEKVATEKANLDEMKGATLDDMSGLVHQLTLKISERKARLAPIIKELRPLRQQNQDLQIDYDERKGHYDSTALQLQSNMNRLETEVKAMRDEILNAESKNLIVGNQKELCDAWSDRLASEMKMYVSAKTEDKKKSLRDKYQKMISDAEKRSKVLKDEQKMVKEAVHDNAKQTKLWGDLERLFLVKKECMERGMELGVGTIHRELGTETLVL